MPQGILDTIGLVAVLVFAIPVALFGVEHLVRGELFQGLVFVAIAALMVAVEQYLTTPTDIPGMVVGKTVGAVVKTDEREDED